MKKLLFTLTLVTLVSINTWAKVRTVSQDASTPAQYTTITSAMAASLAGDTIYIHGSTSLYPNLTINKANLTFIGPGYNPNKDNANDAAFSYLYLDTTGTNQTGRGTKLIGLTISGIYTGGNWGGAANSKNNNVVISRCDIGYIDFSGDGWILKNNYLHSSLNLEYKNNILITNNIFDVCYLQNSNQATVMIANNLFWKGGNVLSSNVSQATFDNNICFGTILTTTASVTLNSMNNNMTFGIFGIGTGAELLPTTNNSGSGNQQAVDPMFNFELVVTNIVSGTALSWAWDFTLQAGSPALTASASGGEIGLYGGAYPWVDNTGMASIPYVKNMNISGVVPAGGNINIDAKGKRHN